MAKEIFNMTTSEFDAVQIRDTDVPHFNQFCKNMVEVTGMKMISREPPTLDWFSGAKHLLDPYLADTPCLRLAKALRSTVSAKLKLAYILVHILWCKLPNYYDVVTESSDGLVFLEEAWAKLLAANGNDEDAGGDDDGDDDDDDDEAWFFDPGESVSRA